MISKLWCCYQMDKQFIYRRQLGSILIWMMFLLLIVSSSSLLVVKQSKAQLVLTSHYDESFKKEKALRRMEREIQTAIEQYFRDLKEDECFPVSRDYHPCFFEDVDHSLWKISARSLLPSELLQVTGRKGCSDDFPVQRVLVQWQSKLFDTESVALFRVCQVMEGDIPQWFVKRELLWQGAGV